MHNKPAATAAVGMLTAQPHGSIHSSIPPLQSSAQMLSMCDCALQRSNNYAA